MYINILYYSVASVFVWPLLQKRAYASTQHTTLIARCGDNTRISDWRRIRLKVEIAVLCEKASKTQDHAKKNSGYRWSESTPLSQSHLPPLAGRCDSTCPSRVRLIGLRPHSQCFFSRSDECVVYGWLWSYCLVCGYTATPLSALCRRYARRHFSVKLSCLSSVKANLSQGYTYVPYPHGSKKSQYSVKAPVFLGGPLGYSFYTVWVYSNHRDSVLTIA